MFRIGRFSLAQLFLLPLSLAMFPAIFRSWLCAVSETLLKKEEFENGALRFSVDGKYFENEAFRKQWRHYNHLISLTNFTSNTNPK